MSIIVRRPDLERFLRSGGRKLLFGRRKTGKTFYVRFMLPKYKYFIVRRGGMFFDPIEGEEYDLRVFLKVCGENVIVDEFHRADPKFFDSIQAGESPENIVLVTSTLHFYKQFVEGPEAPLKGLFSIRRVGLISPIELLATEWNLKGKKLVETLVFYQEPSLIGKSIEDCIISGSIFARSLVGEILDEEDVTYTRRFDAILESVASGASRLSDISSYLYARGLIERASTSYITKYVDTMIKTGLLEKIEIWGRRKGSFYRHLSPLTEIIYYLDSKYSLRDVYAPWEFIKNAVEARLPFLIERFVERFIADYFGLKPVKIMEPEIDVALVRFKKVKVVAEVKWKDSLTTSNLRKIENKLRKFSEAKKILVVPDKSDIGDTSLDVWDVEDLQRKAREKCIIRSG